MNLYLFKKADFKDNFQNLSYRINKSDGKGNIELSSNFIDYQQNIYQKIIQYNKYSNKKYIDSIYGQKSKEIIFLTPTESLIPNHCELIDYIDGSIYNCKLSLDGEKLLVSTQTSMWIYDIKDEEEESIFELNSALNSNSITWTITDVDLSDNKKFLIHSTLNSFIQFFDLEKMKYSSKISLDSNENDFNKCSVYSVRLSGDNSELIAGCGMNSKGADLKIFNIEQNKVIKSIKAHDDDINSINYVERKNSAIFLSGSDDAYGKIWDVRALGINNKPVGYLIGHHAGLTYITSKEDQIYCASNSKDQSIRLWDLRKLANDPNDKKPYVVNFDYRGQKLEKNIMAIHQNMPKNKHFDNSVMTFYGHEVYRTLIRCHFSPSFSTNQRFIYCGSYCGKLYIYDTLTGEGIAKLYSQTHRQTIRDAVWDPFRSSIYITDLNGMIFKWRYNGSIEFEKNSKDIKIKDDHNSDLDTEDV